MITNPTYDAAGPTAGSAAGWTLRSFVAREAIAGFDAPNTLGTETFERWSAFVGELAADAERAFFALAGAETFADGWAARRFVELLEPTMTLAALFRQRSGTIAPHEDFEWSSVREAWSDVIVTGALDDAFETSWRNDMFVVDLDAAVPSAIALRLADGTYFERFEAWPPMARP